MYNSLQRDLELRHDIMVSYFETLSTITTVVFHYILLAITLSAKDNTQFVEALHNRILKESIKIMLKSEFIVI